MDLIIIIVFEGKVNLILSMNFDKNFIPYLKVKIHFGRPSTNYAVHLSGKSSLNLRA